MPLLLIGLVQMFLTADQQIIPVNMSAVAKEYGFDEIERDEKLGGTVTATFFAASAGVSLLAGRLADLVPRIRLSSSTLPDSVNDLGVRVRTRINSGS